MLISLGGCAESPEIEQMYVPIVESSSAPCEVPEPGQPTSDKTEIDVLQPSWFPCGVEAFRTGVVLLHSADGSRPDPTPPVIEDSRGTIYSAALFDPVVLVWNELGEFERVIGAPGQGPGEFAGRPLSLAVDAHDTLHVVDGRGRWLVFDPQHRFVRMASSVGRLRQTAHIISEGRMIYTQPVPAAGAQGLINVTDPGGRLIRSGGQPRPGRDQDLRHRRPSVYAGGELWIAPEMGKREGFVIERRDTTGELSAVFRRHAPWLPLAGYDDIATSPDFKYLHLDDAGYLWVLVAVKDERWKPAKPGDHPDAHEGEHYDLRLEVLDPRAATILASVRFDTASEALPPPIYPLRTGSRRTFRPALDSLGNVMIEIFETRLVQKEEQ